MFRPLYSKDEIRPRGYVCLVSVEGNKDFLCYRATRTRIGMDRHLAARHGIKLQKEMFGTLPAGREST